MILISIFRWGILRSDALLYIRFRRDPWMAKRCLAFFISA